MEKKKHSFITIDGKKHRINPDEKISVVLNKISKKDSKFYALGRDSFYLHSDKCLFDYGITPSSNEKFALFYSDNEFFGPEKEINVLIESKDGIILEQYFSNYTTFFQLKQRIIETKQISNRFQLLWDGENIALPDHLHLFDKLKEDERDEAIIELVNFENNYVDVNLCYDQKCVILKNIPLSKSVVGLFDDIMDIKPLQEKAKEKKLDLIFKNQILSSEKSLIDYFFAFENPITIYVIDSLTEIYLEFIIDNKQEAVIVEKEAKITDSFSFLNKIFNLTKNEEITSLRISSNLKINRNKTWQEENITSFQRIFIQTIENVLSEPHQNLEDIREPSFHNSIETCNWTNNKFNVNQNKKQEKETSIKFSREISFSIILISRTNIRKEFFMINNEPKLIFETLKDIGEKFLMIETSKQIWALLDRIKQEQKILSFNEIADYANFLPEMNLMAFYPLNLPNFRFFLNLGCDKKIFIDKILKENCFLFNMGEIKKKILDESDFKNIHPENLEIFYLEKSVRDEDFIIDYEMKLEKEEICFDMKILPVKIISLTIISHKNNDICREQWTLNFPVNLNWGLLRKTIENYIIFPKYLQIWIIDGQQQIKVDDSKIPEKEILIEQIYNIQIDFQTKEEKMCSPLNVLIQNINCSLDLKSDHYSVFYKNQFLDKRQSLLSYIKIFDLSNIILEIKEKLFKKVKVIIPNQPSYTDFLKNYEETQNIKFIYKDVIEIINSSDYKLKLYHNSQSVQKKQLLGEFAENPITFQLEIIAKYKFFDKRSETEITTIEISNLKSLDEIKVYFKNSISNIKEEFFEFYSKSLIRTTEDFFKIKKKKISIDFLSLVQLKHKNKIIKEIYISKSASIRDLISILKDKIDSDYYSLIYEENTDLICVPMNSNENFNQIFKENIPNRITFAIKRNKILLINFRGEKNQKFIGFPDLSLKKNKFLFEKRFGLIASKQFWTYDGIEMIEDEEKLEFYKISKTTKNEIIYIHSLHTLNICFQDRVLKLENIKSFEKIYDLKRVAFAPLGFQPSELVWSFKEIELINFKTLEENNFSINDSTIAIEATFKADLEYFGFMEKNEYDDPNFFKYFFLENQNILNTIIETIKIEQIDDKDFQRSFRNKITPLFFNAAKKHSKWENIIDNIRIAVFNKLNVKIWSSKDEETFNSTFLLYYYINTENKTLINSLIKSLKKHYPIPIFTKKWNQIYNLDSSTILLENLFWNFNQGFIITSVEWEHDVKGKSILLNELFHTNFRERSKRHFICSDVPEIYFDIYTTQSYPIHIIDIQSGFKDEEAIKKIISLSNLLIIHTKDFNDCKSFSEKLKINLPSIFFVRDQDQYQKNLDLENCFFLPNLMELNKYKLEIQKIRNFCNEIIFNKIANYFDKNEIEKESDIKFLSIFGKKNYEYAIKLKSIEFLDIKKELSYVFNKKILHAEDFSLLNNAAFSPLIISILEIVYDEEINEFDAFRLEKISDYFKFKKEQIKNQFYSLKILPKNNKNEIDMFAFQFKFDKLKQKYASLKKLKFSSKMTILELNQIIEEAVSIYEKEISYNFFSLELFWREIIYFYTCHPNCEFLIQNKKELLKETLIKLWKKSMESGLPFEILDGDILYFPQFFFKEVFKNVNKKVIILSILGPQSSGKSTLLNFMFGCDFTTSEGRCTKGVYGSFFPISNLNNCEGLFLLDTEGLFSILNEVEGKVRNTDFDRQLVLFCFAVSDFVIINNKGDISKETQNVINVCLNSLLQLEQGKEDLAELLLCLNQNNDTIKNHHQEVKSFFDQFILNVPLANRKKLIESIGIKKDNVFVLSNAFDIQTNEIKTKEGEIIRINKKNPREVFVKDCKELCENVFEKFRSKKIVGIKALDFVADRMDYYWRTINEFKYLNKFRKIALIDEENTMINWVDQNLSRNKTDAIYNDFIIEIRKKKNFEELTRIFNEKLESLKKKIIEDFQKDFEKFEEHDKFLEETLEKRIDLMIRDCKNKTLNEIKIKKINQSKLDGDENINFLIKEINEKKIIDENKKINEFNKIWDSKLLEMKKDLNRNTESENLFNEIRDSYSVILRSYKISFPSTELKRQIDLSFTQYLDFLKELVFNMFNRESNMIFDNNGKPLAFVLDVGLGNIKSNYLNIEKMLENKNIDQCLYLEKKSLELIINFEEIYLSLEKISKEPYDIILEEIFKEIAHNLSSIGIKFNFPTFKKKIDNMKKNIWKKIWDLDFFKDILGDKNTMYINLGDLNLIKNTESIFLNFPRINRFIFEYRNSKYSLEHLKRQIFEEGLNWELLLKEIKDRIDIFLMKANFEESISKINKELLRINLYLDLNPIFCKKLLNNDNESFKKKIMAGIINFNEDALTDLNMERQEPSQYLNYKALKEKLLTGEYSKLKLDSNYLIISKKKNSIFCVKNKFKNYEWLQYYCKKLNNDATLESTNLENSLKELLLKNFQFKIFVSNICGGIQNYLGKNSIYEPKNSSVNIFKIVNEIIADANNDLQQVSRIFSFRFMGYLHFMVIHILWKYFEEKNWGKLYQPIAEYEQGKNKQLDYFLKSTSNDIEKRSKAESEKFKEDIILCFKNYSDKEKEKIMNLSISEFQNKFTRVNIQNIIDSEYFSTISIKNVKDVLDYLMSPIKIIQNFLDKEYEKNWLDMCRNFSNNTIVLDSLKIMIDRGKMILTKLKINFGEYETNLEDLINFFEIAKANENEISSNPSYRDQLPIIEYREEISSFFYNYLIDVFFNKKDEQDFILFSKKNALKACFSQNFLKVIRDIPNAHNLNTIPKEIIENFKTSKRKSFNLLKFFNSFVQILEEIKQNSERLFFEINQKEKQIFLQKIAIVLCQQMCPCCNRLCSNNDDLHKTHKCDFGHQIRAIGGIKLINDDASILRCEDVRDSDCIQYNNIEYRWSEFKKQFFEDVNNPWTFEYSCNSIEDKKRKEFFTSIWIKWGEKICEYHQNTGVKINWVPYNQESVENQRAITIQKPNHYILLIDSSRSMEGKKWKNLKESLKDVLSQISDNSNEHLVSIINFSTKASIEYKYQKADIIDVETLTCFKQQTNFCAAFDEAVSLINNDVSDFSTFMIFMTDGIGSYPTNQIKEIKSIVAGPKFLNKQFKFFGLEFKGKNDGSNDKTVKKIVSEFGGELKFAINGEELKKRYAEIFTKSLENQK